MVLQTLLSLALCASSICVSTLNLFQTDYDSDRFFVAPVSYEVPGDIPSGWFPLLAVSEDIPISVSWDSDTREVVIFSEAMKKLRPLLAERRYMADHLPDCLCIRRGVTYCSPQFLVGMLPGYAFFHDGEIYVFSGESVESSLIRPGESERFKAYVLSAMYQLFLESQNDYRFVREHLDGIVFDMDRGSFPEQAIGYIRPGDAVCHILRDTDYGAELASYIGHEAYHVYQYRQGFEITESLAEQYEKHILEEVHNGRP